MIYYRLLKENAVETPEEQLDALPIDGFVNIHKSIDVEWKRAPCRYVNFVKTYFNIISRKKAALIQRQTMLSVRIQYTYTTFCYKIQRTSNNVYKYCTTRFFNVGHTILHFRMTDGTLLCETSVFSSKRNFTLEYTYCVPSF